MCIISHCLHTSYITHLPKFHVLQDIASYNQCRHQSHPHPGKEMPVYLLQWQFWLWDSLKNMSLQFKERTLDQIFKGCFTCLKYTQSPWDSVQVA